MGGLHSPLGRALLVLALLLLRGDISSAMCPSRCKCNDVELSAACVNAGLEIIPIQLNPSAKHIHLSQNKITKLHFTLNLYTSLITLDLSSNKISTIGTLNFEYLRHLKTLNLRGNYMHNISREALKGLRSVVELDLSLNQLEELNAHSFRDLLALEVLILTGNQITWLEMDLLRPCTKLRELMLDDNQLLEVPGPAFSNASHLHKLSLSKNLIVSIEESALPSLPSLKLLSLDTNLISDIHRNAFAGLPALQHLNLNDNNFTTIPTVALAKLSNLTTLQLSGNFIMVIPPVAFRGLFKLRHLHLDRLDRLTRIDSRAFVDNINLEDVQMDSNLVLATIPTRLFHGNPHVVQISIRNNMLSTIAATHFPLDQLRILRLGGNPLRCNCSLLWLWRLEHEQMSSNTSHGTNELVIDSDGIRCAGPEQLEGMLLINAAESQIACSMNWLTVVAASALAGVVVVAIALTLYLRSRLHNRESPRRESASCQTTAGLRLEYEYDHPASDKYIMGPPALYRALPTWENAHKADEPDIYKQFDIAKARPHIVYV